MGTPDFSIPSLNKLIKSHHSVELIVTAPDKERGRGKQVSSTPVKEFALKNNLPVVTPSSLKDPDFIDQLKKIDADLFIVVAFRILPKEVYTIPKIGSFNLHGSLLPKYRGAAPIQWALINGESETGVTTFFLEEKVDTGNIILKSSTQISEEDDFGSLHDKLMQIGAETVMKTVELIEKDEYHLQRQDDSIATPAPKISKEICKINWNKSAKEIHNLIRGLSPYPGAYFNLNNKNFKVYKTRINTEIKLNPAEISQTKSNLLIGTSNGSIEILEIQPEGRKRMNIEDFLRGYSLI